MHWLTHIPKHILLAGLAAVLIWSSPVGAQQISATPPPAPGEEPKGPRFNGAILVEAAGGAYRDSLGLSRLIEELRRSPFTDVIVQVRAQGDAFYNSNLVPRAYGLSEGGADTGGFDPLRIFIDELKRDPANPRRVYAWIETLRVSNTNRALPDPEGHVTQAHPEWLSRNANLDTTDAAGNVYLEPGLPAVQEHLASIAREIVGNYKVDGLVIDGLRYPGTAGEWGYHPEMIDKWRAITGSPDRPAPNDPTWNQLRRDAINETLRRISTAAREAGQANVIAMAVTEGPAPRNIEEFPFTEVSQGALQDWPAWMQNKMVDAVIVKNFRRETEESDLFDAWNAFAQQMVKSTGVEAMPAVAGYENISIDALAQMKRVREMGFAGVALSNVRDLILDTASREIFYRALASSALSPKSVRVEMDKAMVPTEIPEQALVVAAAPQPEPAAEPMEEPAAQPGEPAEMADAAPELTEIPDGSQVREMVGTGQRFENLLEPAPGSVDYLKRKFKNIF